MFKSQLKTLSVIVFSSLIISQSYSADDSKQLDVSESAFKCLSALAASGRFFVDNILGNLDATLAVAKIRKAVISVFLYEQRSTMVVSYLQWNQRARSAQVLTRFHSGILQVLQKEFLLLVYRIGGSHCTGILSP